MSFLPIAHRELISAARKPATWIRRTLFFVTILVIAAFVVVDSASSTPARQGEKLFDIIAVCLVVYASTIGVHATADAFGWEKREGTLGLLFLTDLSGGDVVAGKLAAKATNAFYGLLSMLPLLAMPLLLGGVRLERVVLTSVMLIATSIASLSIGLWVSSRSTNERRAMMATFGLLLIYLAGPVVAAAMSEQLFHGRSEDSWMYGAVSPLMGLIHVQIITTGSGGAPPWPGNLWIYSLGFTLLISVVAIVGAARHLPHSWSPELLEARKKRKHRPANAASSTTPNASAPKLAFFKQVNDSLKRRYAKRQRPLLNIHPYVWLGERFADKRLMAAVMTALILAIPIVCLPGRSLRFDLGLVVPFFYIAALLLLIWMIAEPIVRLNEDRRTGALELILTTPLQGPEIVRGMQRSMLRIFLIAGTVLALAVAATNYFAIEGAVGMWAVWLPVLFLTPCFVALRWVGPWIGLSSKSVTMGMLKALLLMLMPAFLWISVINLLNPLRNWNFQPIRSAQDYILAWSSLLISALAWIALIALCRRIHHKLGRGFWSTLLAFCPIVFVALVALVFSAASFWLWGDFRTNLYRLGIFLFHAFSMALIAYGWAKPQLELRFRDLATRPFES